MEPSDPTELARAYARCFADGDGRRVLEHLQNLTLRRNLGPDAPEAMLRHLEGQRALVATILGLAARGGATLPPRS